MWKSHTDTLTDAAKT